jgi:hypothetical protein
MPLYLFVTQRPARSGERSLAHRVAWSLIA